MTRRCSGACFCTGACQRTPEQQAAYERQKREFSNLLIYPILPIADEDDDLVDELLKGARRVVRLRPITPYMELDPIPTEDEG